MPNEVPTRKLMGGGLSSALRELDDSAYEAAADGDDERLTELLGKGADPNHMVDEKKTPLMASAQEGAHECMRILLAHKNIEVNRADKWGMTALHLACHWGYAGCVEMLLAAGADAGHRAKGGTTAAHTAAARDNLHCLRVLLGPSGGVDRAGVDLADARDGEGKTPYDAACEMHSDGCIEFLEARSDLHGVGLGEPTV